MADDDGGSAPSPLKRQTANALKWNLIDKVGSQLLYAVTGVVLARELTQTDFGLIGAVAVFQALGAMFIDSGFSSALIQRRDTSERDYSTVFWFNLLTALALYALLWVLAPWIARIFQGDPRIVGLARVMFLTFPLNALSLVPVSRLVRAMDVKPVALATNSGLAAGCVVGVGMALGGCGAWAIVGQNVTLGLVKASVLWLHDRWLPAAVLDWRRLRAFFRVGAGVMATSFLNTVFQNITAFFTGNRLGLVPLGYFTQADKWSKMGVMSLSQVITSTFLPVLSSAQDDAERFARLAARMHRLTAYLLFPAMGFLAVMAAPLFHALFGPKWDGAIPLFQLLLLKGVFTVLSLQESNCLLSLGLSARLVVAETVRDVASVAFIFLAFPVIALKAADDALLGVQIFVWGQVMASCLSWGVVLVMTSRAVRGRTLTAWLADCVPYLALTLLAMALMSLAGRLTPNCWGQMAVMGAVGAAVYLGVNGVLRSRVQADAMAYLLHKKF